MTNDKTDKFNFAPKAHISISRVDHSSSIMKAVDDIFNKQLFTDVVLSCENQIINSHRLILAASSSFFYSLFSSQPACLTQNPVIIIRDVKICELKAILEFVYYGQTSFPEENINSLIKSAEILGIYGLGKLSADQVHKEVKEDETSSQEINNNNLNKSTSLKLSPKANNKEKSRSTELNNKSNQINKEHSNSNLDNSSKHQEKSKRKLSQNRQAFSDTEEDQIRNQDLEEKRKKKEIINQSTTNQSTTNQSTSNQSNQQSNSQQSTIKRQSLRIRYRKDNPENPDSSKNAFELLNTSNNSEISLSEVTNGKRLRRDEDDEQVDDELMSIDDSQYNSQPPFKDESQQDNTNGNSLIASKIASMKEKTLKLKRNKSSSNSLLKKQNEQSKQFKSILNKDSFNIVSKRQLDDLGLQTTNEALSDDEDNDDLVEENIAVKKVDSASTSLSTSRKNSLDLNNQEDLVVKLSRNNRNDLNESTSDNQSLLASSKQQQQQHQKKKKRKLSIDANT